MSWIYLCFCWSKETVTIFCASFVIFFQFLTIYALKNDNWASLGPFKRLFLPMALQNHITAGSDERLTFCFGPHTRSCSGIKSCETPLEVYPDWLNLHKRLRFRPQYANLHHDNVFCSLQRNPPHLVSSSHFTLCGTTRLSPPTRPFPFSFAYWFL